MGFTDEIWLFGYYIEINKVSHDANFIDGTGGGKRETDATQPCTGMKMA